MNDVNCKYSDGIVPYMYGELATAATTEFEAHLVDCQTCTDEFAAMSAARYEVYDWKKLEFDPLPTPVIEIPFEVAPVSWVEKVRAAFSASWALPAAAFAGLAIVSVLLGVVVTSRNSVSEVVQRDVNSLANIKKPDQSPIPSTKANEQKVDTPKPERSGSRPALIRDSDSRRPVRTQPAVAPRTTTRRPITATQTPTVPRLNDFVEEEDNSLRLAELFEDIDTSE